MVSLWPWKVDDTTSFEKTLSSLSSKISKANVKLNNLRTRSRRVKALWTIYASVTYIFCTLILVLVTGWQNWGTIEYGVEIGSPVVIYLVRMGLATYYTYRLSSLQSHLDALNAQREAAIEKFKTATKFNSTQQLLEKYGAAPSSSSSSVSVSKSPSSSVTKRQPSKGPSRTNLPPPATANIRRPEIFPPFHDQPPIATESPLSQTSPLLDFSPQRVQTEKILPTAEFAPNAFSPSPRDFSFSGSPTFAQSASLSQRHHIPKWYDRFLDVLLGEDESRAANRLALICSNCKLVNGQAPPGIQQLEDVGRWRCAECRAWNGAEIEVERIIEAVGGVDSSLIKQELSDVPNARSSSEEPRKDRINKKLKSKLDGVSEVVFEDDEPLTAIDEDSVDGTVNEQEDEDGSESVVDSPPAQSTRSRTKRATKR